MRNDFYGWYFRCQSHQQTLALIPSLHRTAEGGFANLQLITDDQSFHITFPDSDVQRKDDEMIIGGSRFGKKRFFCP